MWGEQTKQQKNSPLVHLYMRISGSLRPRANVVGILLAISNFHVNVPRFLLLAGAANIYIYI